MKVPAPLPAPEVALADQDQLTLLAMAIWGEARNQPYEAKVGVGCVVRNRVAYQGKYGNGFKGVILKPYAFSSFNTNDPNSAKMLRPVDGTELAHKCWEDCYQAAEDAMYGLLTDPTFGAVFYFSPPLKEPPKKRDGSSAWGDVWATVTIGDLHFYRDKPPVAQPAYDAESVEVVDREP